jgi:pyridoxal 5'-phosphate synthase pdxT subunit
MSRPVGVLSIQGDFDKHIQALSRIGQEAAEVRTAEDLERVDRLIIPGGESTTVGMLLSRFGLGDEIKRRASEGMPVWGTCMGMIIMASDVENGRTQDTLGLLDITVRRNAFGTQVHSFEDSVRVQGLAEPVTGVFIRAPIVSRLGEGVETLAEYEGQVVAVQQGKLVGTSFHPELTDDTRMHEWFVGL